MINPYQAPPEDSLSPDRQDGLAAEFQLTRRQIRFALSKFLLLRCGARLTIASIAMIGLAMFVAMQPPGFLSPGIIADLWIQTPLFAREVGVMAVATAVYLMLILNPRRAIRIELERHGIVDGAVVSVAVDQGRFVWSTADGTFDLPVEMTFLFTTGRGAVIRLARNLFLFIPKQGAFSTGRYRDFVRGVQQAQVGLA